MLDQMQHRRLAPRIPRRARRIAAKRRNAARHHHLALHARHRAPLDARPSETPTQGLLIALVQQLQEREQRKVRARDVDVERLGHLVHRRLDEEFLAELGEGQGRVPPVGGRADDARVGDDEVEEACVRGDVVDGGLERGLGGHVALEGDEDRRVRGGGGFEDGEAPAEEVDFAGAVDGEGARHGQADSWGGVSGWEGEEGVNGGGTAAAAGDDGHHAVDAEEGGGVEGRGHGALGGYGAHGGGGVRGSALDRGMRGRCVLKSAGLRVEDQNLGPRRRQNKDWRWPLLF